jgi:hypothetical protein
MNLEEMAKRFLLSDVEIRRMLEYFKKIETAGVHYCSDHDIEYISGEECYACRSESDDFMQSSVKQERHNRNWKLNVKVRDEVERKR